MKFFDSGGAVMSESGAYDPAVASFTTTPLKIYEARLGMSSGLAASLGLTAGESFHFVLNNYVVKDNRIPPRGFTNANFQAIQSPPVGYSYADGQYWDETARVRIAPAKLTYGSQSAPRSAQHYFLSIVIRFR